VASPGTPFTFVQFEFAHPLGPADGRYLRRPAAGEEPLWVIVLRTLGAPQRRAMGERRKRKPAPVEAAEQPAAVPIARATLIRPEPLDSVDAAVGWLALMRGDEDARGAEVGAAVRELNAVVRAHRAAAADPYSREVSARGATVVRIGYGSGDLVADGRYAAAYELPPPSGPSKRTEALAPQERLAAILGGGDAVMPSEELVLRARLDVEDGRMREAALQARIALEALLADMRGVDAGGTRLGQLLAELGDDRSVVGDAANAALEGEPSEALAQAVKDAVTRMDQALRHLRRST
jgi:hypothetical protein